MITFIEIMVILLLISANGFFAMAEIALISARRLRLQQLAEEGDKRAVIALELTKSINRLLSTAQVGITLVGILTGALGGATLGDKLAVVLSQVTFLKPYSQGLAIALVVIIITYFSLVVGELIPKRVALSRPEQTALKVAKTMRVLEVITRPIVNLLSHSTDLGLKILRVKPVDRPPVTEEEIKILLEEGTRVGVIEEAEQDMLEGVMRFGDRTIDDIMSPRTEIEWIDLDEPLSKIISQVRKSKHTRFPAAHGDLDEVQGILISREFLSSCIQTPKVDLIKLLRKPLFMPETMSALKALELFKVNSEEIALVIDEYGGTLGLVTLHDVLTEIVGELPLMGEEAEPQILEREDGSWLLDGLLPVEELKDLLELDELPDEDKVGYQTVGGLVMSQLDGIPVSGEHFIWKNHRFEVVDMDERRVDKVLVTEIPAKPDEKNPKKKTGAKK